MGGRVYKVEETSAAGQLELLLDITRMEAQDILRRFLKGDRCILVYTHRDIHCLWFDLSDMNISKIRYSCPMDKGSVFLYEHGTVGREKKLNRHVLYSALEYLKKAGFNACCIAVREKNHLLINQLKREGFKKSGMSDIPNGLVNRLVECINKSWSEIYDFLYQDLFKYLLVPLGIIYNLFHKQKMRF